MYIFKYIHPLRITEEKYAHWPVGGAITPVNDPLKTKKKTETEALPW